MLELCSKYYCTEARPNLDFKIDSFHNNSADQSPPPPPPISLSSHLPPIWSSHHASRVLFLFPGQLVGREHLPPPPPLPPQCRSASHAPFQCRTMRQAWTTLNSPLLGTHQFSNSSFIKSLPLWGEKKRLRILSQRLSNIGQLLNFTFLISLLCF